MHSRPSFALSLPLVECDFAPLLGVPGGRAALARFALTMSGSWQAIARAVQVSDPAAADLVHRFLSQVLAVEAGAIGERLAALEAGLRRGTPPEPARLVAELGPLIESLQRQTEEAIRPGPDAGP